MMHRKTTEAQVESKVAEASTEAVELKRAELVAVDLWGSSGSKKCYASLSIMRMHDTGLPYYQ